MKKIKKRGFTLAETMTVILIIGIILAITIPSLVRRQYKIVNITKVKNAMKLYSDVINRIVIDYDLNNNTTLSQWATEEGSTDCKKISAYFRYIQGSGCTFKTDDGIWWDVSNISKPIISLKNSDLNTINANDFNKNNTFYMLGYFDEDGIIRINDKGYEDNRQNNKTNIKIEEKLWYYITQQADVLSGVRKCKAKNQDICPIGETPLIYKKFGELGIYVTDPESQTSQEAIDALNNGSTCGSGYNAGSSCIQKGDYWQAAVNKCIANGGHAASRDELQTLYAENPDYFKNSCSAGTNCFWSSENSSTVEAYTMNNEGKISHNLKNTSYRKVICIGD